MSEGSRFAALTIRTMAVSHEKTQIMNPIRVKYEGGVFKPLTKHRKLKEGAIGEVHIDDMSIETSRKRASIKESEFFGLWKNRKDMDDGLSFVRNLRSKSRY